MPIRCMVLCHVKLDTVLVQSQDLHPEILQIRVLMDAKLATTNRGTSEIENVAKLSQDS